MTIIQWFPGHMSKAIRNIQECLKFIDFVTIVVDSRIPSSSTNPMITKIIGDKPKLLILNKVDLADPMLTPTWKSYFEKNGIKTLSINAKEQITIKKVTQASKNLMNQTVDRRKKHGIQTETFRTMIIGIPNVGKSTLMNRLAGKKVAPVGKTPGVTKGYQWINLNKHLNILDTPGILWPKFEDKAIALKLALTGAITDRLLPMEEVTIFGINYFQKFYLKNLQKRFKNINFEQKTPELIMDLTENIGYKSDYNRFYSFFIKEIRDGKLGRYTLDRLNRVNDFSMTTSYSRTETSQMASKFDNSVRKS